MKKYDPIYYNTTPYIHKSLNILSKGLIDLVGEEKSLEYRQLWNSIERCLGFELCYKINDALRDFNEDL